MNVNPDMDELRRLLTSKGVDFVADDSEEETDEWSGCILHVERTLFTSPDGREFVVVYAWLRDEDEQKHFLPPICRFGYLDVTVDERNNYSATPEEVLEDVSTHVT